MADFIPNVYKYADKKIIKVIEKARKEITENGGLQEWWRCGDCFCTQYNNGYYHVFVPENCEIYGKILRVVLELLQIAVLRLLKAEILKYFNMKGCSLWSFTNLNLK